MTFDDIWNDPVWSKVIGGVITAIIIGLFGFLKWPKRLWGPSLRLTNAYPEEQDGATFPLKYYVEVINDSRRCVEVHVSEYRAVKVTVPTFPLNTLQIMFLSEWFPIKEPVDAVSLLPKQRCRAWIGVDSKTFNIDDLQRLKGKIGTLTLTANGTKFPFEL